MKTLWIFNPENDIALSNNLLHFTPPRNALLLRRYGAMIMSWLAEDGDYILADNEHFHSSPIVGSCDNFPTTNSISVATIFHKKNLQFFNPSSISDITNIRPWGWSKAIIGEMKHLGFNSSILPAIERIEAIRQLSHRRSSIFINTHLKEMGFHTNIPLEIHEIDELPTLLKKQSPIVLKSPWSSSGRGVMFSDDINVKQLTKLASGILKKQGSVMVEPKLDPILDFAMLFEMKEGLSRYKGLSVFQTLGKGNYSGNIVSDEMTLMKYLTPYVPISKITALQSALSEILTNLIGYTYDGICGIDMMIYRADNGEYDIAPCIELNLRYTMGYVAHRLAERLMMPGKSARMEISYIGNREKSDTLPPVFDAQGKLISGTLNLVPENNYFHFALTPYD